MKIDASTTTSPLTGATTSGGSVRSSKAAQQKTSGSSDSVTLSNTSSQIQALDSGIAEASGFDSAKVEAIKQAISEGRFTINPGLIADRLIASARELASQREG
jgi:negative regulator of flagellin synthesis FlgM